MRSWPTCPPTPWSSAYYTYITHLSITGLGCTSGPLPSRRSTGGLLNQEGCAACPFANQVQYVFLPVQLDPGDQKVLNEIRSQFVLVRRVNDVVLLRRHPGP